MHGSTQGVSLDAMVCVYKHYATRGELAEAISSGKPAQIASHPLVELHPGYGTTDSRMEAKAT